MWARTVQHCNWLLSLTLCAAVVQGAKAGDEDKMPEGMRGWTYHIGYNKGGFASTPSDACIRTALNHFGVGLHAMIRRPDVKAGYDCVYKNPIGGLVWGYTPTYLHCNAGYAEQAPGICVKWAEPPRPSSCDPDQAGFAYGNPVQVSSGAKVQTETDLPGMPNGVLRIDRTYRSLRANGAGQSAGHSWSFSFDRSFILEKGLYDSASIPPAAVRGTFADGASFVFVRQPSGEYLSTYDRGETLRNLDAVFDDWVLTTSAGSTERFKKINGKYLLVSAHTREGHAQFYSYSPDNKLATVSDTAGRTLTVTWAGDTVSAINGAAGSVRYGYEMEQSAAGTEIPGTERLATVEYYDEQERLLAARRYHYEHTSYRYLLTGITDENGVRFATYAYDDAGRAISSEHAGGANRFSFTYPEKTKRIITDPLGTRREIDLVYGRDSLGRISRASQPAGAGSSAGVHTLTYDSIGRVTSSIDANGEKTCFITEPARGWVTRRVSGLGAAASCPGEGNLTLPVGNWRVVSTRWHPDIKLETAVASPMRITTYVYNGQRDAGGVLASCAGNAKLPNGKPIAVLCSKTVQATRDPNGAQGFAAPPSGRPRTWRYSYNEAGQLLKVTGPTDASGQAESLSLAYYTDTTATHTVGDLASIQNANGETTRFLEYTQAGLPSKIRRAGGDLVNVVYDGRQRITSRTIEDGKGGAEASHFAYDDAGQLTRITFPDGAALTWGYDDAHRMTSMKDGAGNGVHMTLDGMGNVTRQEVRNAKGELVRENNFAFDALSRLASVRRSLQSPATTYQYDRVGNLTTIMDALGRVTSRRFDNLGRLVRETMPQPASGVPAPTIAYDFDLQDQIRGVEDPRKLVTRYTVDGHGERSALNSPDTGAAAYTFDDAGNLVSSRDARDVTTSYRYDATRRVTQIGTSRFSYGKPGTSATGRLTAMTDDSGSSSFTYDGFGRPQTSTHTIGSGAAARKFSLAYTYGQSGSGSSTGHVTSMTYPSGNRILIGYNADGRAASLSLVAPNAATPAAVLSNIGYTALGDVERWNWGDPARLNPYRREFDAAGRIKSYPLGHPKNGGMTRTLSYDHADRITAISHAGAARLDQRYAYDGLDRLIGVEGANISQAFEYDANGNRTRARFGGGTYVNTIDAASNRLARTSGPVPAKVNAYDKAGNLISDGTATYTYGANGRMTAATVGGIRTTYSYNGFGERVAKSGTAGILAYYVYDEAGRLIGEYDRSGKAIQETVYLGDLPVAVLKPGVGSTELFAVYADHILTPRVITRLSDNRMVWRWDNVDPFGLQQPDESPSGLPSFVYNPRFPGQVYDKETNNHYNYYRDYDPSTGRYVQSDPIGLKGGINTYMYVNNDPLAKVDPFGLTGTAVGWGTRFATAGTAMAIDGPLPVGDIIAAGIIAKGLYDVCKKDEPCPPCKTVSGQIVPVGTIGYRPRDTPDKPQHGIVGAHHNIYRANQNPKNCQCFWQAIGAVPPSALPAGAIPIEPFAN